MKGCREGGGGVGSRVRNESRVCVEISDIAGCSE